MRSPLATPARLLAVGTLALGLSGCNYMTEALWPSMGGSEPARSSDGPIVRQEIPPSAAEQRAMTTTSSAAIAATPDTGRLPAGQSTAVGQRAQQLRGEVQNLQGAVQQRAAAIQQMRGDAIATSQRYFSTVAGVNARLQVGTTPGNPILQSQWNTAAAELDRMSAEIGRMSQMSSQVSADAAMAAFLLDSTRAAYSLSGAVEDDHRQLALVEDEVNRTVVSIDRLLNELNEDIGRQSTYIGRERSNLTALSLAIRNGELFGTGLNNRAFTNVTPPDGSPAILGVAPGAAPQAGNPAQAAAGRRPLMVIRFDRANPAYEQALYTAVSRALERSPAANFDLVAVAPSRGGQSQAALAATTARRQAETVMRSLADMGLPAQRVTLSSTTSNQAQANEVHLFVR
ncbi:MAG: hypothetical protein J0H39_14370 [Alphaproteobacteria bacterium]|nr:hypothetical protein [Alphaproteobacteria bacterium]MBN9497937.1 hypothetical protein [Alphaproteobacteria bacterium]